MGIAAKIERSRIALLRLLFCWMSLAHCVRAASEKPLPRRLTRLVFELLGKAELATTYLIIAAFYASQVRSRRNPHMEAIAALLIGSGSLKLGAGVTHDQIKTRIRTLQHMLHNLEMIAQNIARNTVLIELVQRMNFAAGLGQISLARFSPITVRRSAKPP